MKPTNTTDEIKNTSASEYPGVAIDIADNDKTNEKLVKERTATINNNPRNNDGPKKG